MPHRAGKLASRRTLFLIQRIFAVIFCIVFIGFIAYLVVDHLMSLGWGIFFIGYLVFLMILDFYWSTGIILVRRRWLYWVKTRDDADFFKKIKDPKEYRYWKQFYLRRIALLFIAMGYILAWGIWLLVETNQVALLIICIVLLVIVIVGTFYRFSDILLK